MIAAGAVMSIRLFGRSEPGLPSMWGSAAWAQTQLTPGVSTLAAPRSSFRVWLKRVGREIAHWRGKSPDPRSGPESVLAATGNSFVGLSQRCFICGHELNSQSHGEHQS